MLTQKELMNLTDFLTMQEQSVKTLNELSGQIQDEPTKQFLQNLARKNEENFATLGAYINYGQKIHMQGM